MPQKRIVKTPLFFADKFVFVVAKFVGPAQLCALLVASIYSLWIGWAFSAKLRALLDSTFWSILIYVAATGFIFALGLLAQRFVYALSARRAAFGELGGLPCRTMLAAVKASKQIEVDLSEHDQPLVRQLNV